MSAIGKPLDRVEGLLKVTGQARYAGEFPEEGLLHGSVVSSTVAKGRVLRIDATKALALPGVVDVIHHLNRPKIASYDDAFQDDDAADGSPFRPLYNDRVLYSGQPLALVIADNLELARHAGSLVEIEYETEAFETDLLALQEQAHASRKRRPSRAATSRPNGPALPSAWICTTAPPLNTTTRWSPTPAPCCISRTARCISTTRPKARRTARPMCKKSSAWIKARCVSSRLSSVAPLVPACARSTNCRWR